MGGLRRLWSACVAGGSDPDRYQFVADPSPLSGSLALRASVVTIYVVNSAVAIAVVSAVTASAATAILHNLGSIWAWRRKVISRIDLRLGQWWTRNWRYIPRSSRSRIFAKHRGGTPAPIGSTLRAQVTQQAGAGLETCLGVA